MGFDILVMGLPPGIQSVGQIPDDFEPGIIGSRSEIITMISEVMPHADFSDPAWGTIDGPDFCIEVSIAEDENVKSFAFHVRGSDTAKGAVAEILSALKLPAVDSDSGELFRPEDASDAIRQWHHVKNVAMGIEQPPA